jgi:hypothetical protein
MSDVPGDQPQSDSPPPAEQPVPPQEGLTTFPSGAVRSADVDHLRYDLITPVGLRRLAQTCAEGAAKYGDHNWVKGIPQSQMLSHAINHLSRYLDGDDSEDHLAHAAWNILGACHMEEKKPEMMDIPTRSKVT